MVGEGFLSVPLISWSNAFGSHPPVNFAGGSDSFAGVKVRSAGETEQGVDKHINSTTHLAFSLGNVKNSRVVPKPHEASFSLQSPFLELGFTHKHLQNPYTVEQQNIGVVSAYGSHMLPLNMETEDGTIYVNSKQYNGIIRRRQSRAKAAAAASVLNHNKLNPRCRKPYMHHSRHLHALRRPRGSGGRFLNTKSQDNAKKVDETKQSQSRSRSRSQSQQSNSQNSEVVHPENLSMNLSILGSEATSMNYFLSSSVHSHGGIVMPSKWIVGEATTMDNGFSNFKT